MKKFLFFLALAIVAAASFSSCKKDKGDDNASQNYYTYNGVTTPIAWAGTYETPADAGYYLAEFGICKNVPDFSEQYYSVGRQPEAIMLDFFAGDLVDKKLTIGDEGRWTIMFYKNKELLYGGGENTDGGISAGWVQLQVSGAGAGALFTLDAELTVDGKPLKIHYSGKATKVPEAFGYGE